jgi:hypothetical protein
MLKQLLSPNTMFVCIPDIILVIAFQPPFFSKLHLYLSILTAEDNGDDEEGGA